MILISSILKAKELSTHPYWLKLLHYKDNTSQIDDPSFFLSPIGKTSPKDELLATLKAIKKDNPKDNNSTQCLFPARTRWLKEMLPKEHIKECINLNPKLKELGFKNAYMVYTSSLMNSPASAFGHTFLRFDKDSKTPLLSYGVTYSAKVDTHNLFKYAYNGVFGGFEGRYTIAPYYSIVKRYSNMESRDMWEYKLKLTQKEIEKMTLHIIEMQKFYSDYYFNSENCAYNLLWFIDIAKENIELTKEFNYIVTPLDIIKKLKDKSLIESSKLRASKTTKIKNIYKSIKRKDIAKKFYNNPDISIIKNLSIDEQQKIIDMTMLDKSNNQLLKYRSKLGISKDKKIIKTDPTHTNLSSRLNISLSDKSQLLYGFRASYHDIYDIDYDFNFGEYISFFDIQMIDDRLKSIDFIKINSLAIINDLYHPISWGLDIGYKDERAYIDGKAGVSFSFYNTLIFYEPTIELSNQIKLGYQTGAIKRFHKTKFGIIDNSSDIESFFTYQFDDNMAINIRKKSHLFSFGLFYYF